MNAIIDLDRRERARLCAKRCLLLAAINDNSTGTKEARSGRGNPSLLNKIVSIAGEVIKQVNKTLSQDTKPANNATTTQKPATLPLYHLDRRRRKIVAEGGVESVTNSHHDQIGSERVANDIVGNDVAIDREWPEQDAPTRAEPRLADKVRNVEQRLDMEAERIVSSVLRNLRARHRNSPHVSRIRLRELRHELQQSRLILNRLWNLT